jgi:hypothetical protein
MPSTYRTTASAVRTASIAAVSALVCLTASAAAAGSTDMYAPNGIAASFGTGAHPAASPVPGGTYSGSTDTWGVNGFRASFGGSNPVAPSVSACATGSTDIYGPDAFAISFGSPVALRAGDLALACGVPVPLR